MSATNTSFWPETRRTYFLYMIAGAAAIPAGVVYAALAADGWDRWWTTLPLLAAGVFCALLAWRHFEKHLTFTSGVKAMPSPVAGETHWRDTSPKSHASRLSKAPR